MIRSIVAWEKAVTSGLHILTFVFALAALQSCGADNDKMSHDRATIISLSNNARACLNDHSTQVQVACNAADSGLAIAKKDSIFLKENDGLHVDIGKLHFYKARILEDSNNFPKALTEFFNAEQEFEHCDSQELEALAYTSMANICADHGDYPQAKDYVAKALSRKNLSSEDFAVMLLNEGYYFYRLGEYDVALIVEKIARQYLWALDNNNKANLFQNLGMVQIALADNHKTLLDGNLVRRLYDSAWMYAKSELEQNNILISRINFSGNEQEKDSLACAILANSHRPESDRSKLASYRQLYEVEKKCEYLQRAESLRAQLFDSDPMREMQGIMLSERSHILEKQHDEEKRRDKQKELNDRWIIVIVLVILLCLAWMLWILMDIRNKKNPKPRWIAIHVGYITSTLIIFIIGLLDIIAHFILEGYSLNSPVTVILLVLMFVFGHEPIRNYMMKKLFPKIIHT